MPSSQIVTATKRLVLGALYATVIASTPGIANDLVADTAIECAPCDEWNRPHEPFRIFGPTYYVGTAELSAILIVSDTGHVLIDGGLPQSAPLIANNIRQLGFQLADVRWILNSHAHFDHAGGIAALQRASGAKVVASKEGARALEQGEPLPNDPQHGLDISTFPHVGEVHVVDDGQELTAGDLTLTAHHTPGHTPGGTTWTWRSCEGEQCLDVVYADSLTAVSGPGFLFSGDTETTFRRSIARVATLPCDILLTPHPGFIDLKERYALLQIESGANPFRDPEACKAYASNAEARLDRRVREETSVSIKATVERWWRAWQDKNIQTVDQMSLPDYTEFTGSSDRPRVGKESLLEIAEEAFGSVTITDWHIDELSVSVQGDTAVVFYTWSEKVETAEGMRSLRGVASDVLVRRDNKWLYLSHHSTPALEP